MSPEQRARAQERDRLWEVLWKDRTNKAVFEQIQDLYVQDGVERTSFEMFTMRQDLIEAGISWDELEVATLAQVKELHASMPK